MKEMQIFSIPVGDTICFEVSKRGGATVRGNTVHDDFSSAQSSDPFISERGFPQRA